MTTTPLDVANQLYTVRDWLRYAVSHFEEAGIFYGHGTDNAYDEAAWLILAALQAAPADDGVDPAGAGRCDHEDGQAVGVGDVHVSRAGRGPG